jgi:hypothetical protein
MYVMSHIFEVVVFILYSFWVPQIICNATRDCRGAISTYVNTCSTLSVRDLIAQIEQFASLWRTH